MDPDRIAAIVHEEEALLGRVLLALSRVGSAPRASEEGMRSTEELRALREEASTLAEDDLPSVLHEMSVRARLRQRASTGAQPSPEAPYIAHLRVRDARGERDYLLGHQAFVDARHDVRIVDWRTAPIAQVFYRHREGDDYELEIDDRVLEGTVVARRVITIDRGRLVRISSGGVTLVRPSPAHASEGTSAWIEESGAALSVGGTGTAARAGVIGVGVGGSARSVRADVTALLDPHQHRAITTPPEVPILVVGSAGSGKTTVALHRLARIAAADPERYPLEEVLVVVPEEGLARLSRRLLAPLGVHEAQIHTLDAWAHALARAELSPVPPIAEDTPAIVARLRRHPALFDALSNVIDRLPAERTKNARVLRASLARWLSDRAFLADVVARSAGDLPGSAIEETVRHTMRQLADPFSRQLASITDERMSTAIDGREIVEGTPEATAGSVDLEDLPILLWARARRQGLSARASIAHLVIDEAEDFSLFELSVLATLLREPRSVTLAGDDLQQTEAGFPGWERVLSALGVRGAERIRLEVSYRCPQPIVDLAQRVLGIQDEARSLAARAGAPVIEKVLPTEAHAHLEIAEMLGDLSSREPHASIAVIAEEREGAVALAPIVAELGARLVLDGEFDFAPGIDVTHVDAIKGLEFDYVIVPDARPPLVGRGGYDETPSSRRRLHVAITRASYQLALIASGRLAESLRPR